MTTLVTYGIILKIIKDFIELENIDKKMVNEVKLNTKSFKKSTFPVLRILAELFCMQLDLEQQQAKKNGKGNKVSGCKNILKASANERFYGAWYDENNKFCLISGYHAVRLNESVGGIPMLPENQEKFNLSQCYPKIDNNSNVLELPTIGELKTYIKKEKTENPEKYKQKSNAVLFNFGYNKPAVNAKYLLDILTIFPDLKTAKYNNLVSPIYFESIDGDAILLPMRKNESVQAEEKADFEKENNTKNTVVSEPQEKTEQTENKPTSQTTQEQEYEQEYEHKQNLQHKQSQEVQTKPKQETEETQSTPPEQENRPENQSNGIDDTEPEQNKETQAQAKKQVLETAQNIEQIAVDVLDKNRYQLRDCVLSSSTLFKQLFFEQLEPIKNYINDTAIQYIGFEELKEIVKSYMSDFDKVMEEQKDV